jgi:hypothetical protein
MMNPFFRFMYAFFGVAAAIMAALYVCSYIFVVRSPTVEYFLFNYGFLTIVAFLLLSLTAHKFGPLIHSAAWDTREHDAYLGGYIGCSFLTASVYLFILTLSVKLFSLVLLTFIIFSLVTLVMAVNSWREFKKSVAQ